MRSKFCAASVLSTAMLLSACDGTDTPPEGAPTEAAQAEWTPSAFAIPEGAEPVADMFIDCAFPNYDGQLGITITQNFLVLDGQTKRYDARTRQARDMCYPGMVGCSLEAGDGRIASDYTAPNGTRTETKIDAETLEVTKILTEPGKEPREVAFDGGCEAKPMPTLAG
ncbi:hypothetical protein QWY75_07105 [Pontixanthobacter aestiaquae]|uniref:NlpE N-terminal domain-containing protein n=1 Tax=Pontixanthobacter aestiaquae TaxID=1509367 RepID=A0A844Z707_9SPHN|nr:hypothetical protein [Pontixanthobacter aestiaquae]MDN3645971.1 hypothetical protein [Pontixanthobacter aestiaquae]MXO83036.1 hypothetical protein [Pontixanthobacter aestiaquae]